MVFSVLISAFYLGNFLSLYFEHSIFIGYHVPLVGFETAVLLHRAYDSLSITRGNVTRFRNNTDYFPGYIADFTFLGDVTELLTTLIVYFSIGF